MQVSFDVDSRNKGSFMNDNRTQSALAFSWLFGSCQLRASAIRGWPGRRQGSNKDGISNGYGEEVIRERHAIREKMTCEKKYLSNSVTPSKFTAREPS